MFFFFNVIYNVLDDFLCIIDFKYSRKKKQFVREYFKFFQKSLYNVIRGGDDIINEVVDMYEYVRFEIKVCDLLIF